MNTSPSNKRKRFANPQPLDLETRVSRTKVNGGIRVGDSNSLFVSHEERLMRARCAELSLSFDQVHQLAAQSGHDMLYVLGLDPQTMQPLRSRRWLWMAAQTSSISYRTAMTPEVLLEVLSTGAFPRSLSAPVVHFINEAPLQVVVMAIEEAAHESGLDISLIWRNVARIAKAMSCTRLALVIEKALEKPH